MVAMLFAGICLLLQRLGNGIPVLGVILGAVPL